jgi:hypothetical protein
VDILIAPGSRLAARRFCAGCRALSRIREHWMPERSRFDLAALPVCGPACDGRPTKAEPVADAGPAALAHGTCMAHLLHVGRSVFNLLESVVVRM